MTWVGVLGHDDLDAGTDAVVRVALYDHLATVAAGSGRSGLVGVCRLDEGTGAAFAEVVLELRGRLHVVEPGGEWVRRTVSVRHAARYLSLRLAARRVHAVPADDEGVDVASWCLVAELADELVAVWDGSPGLVARVVRASWARGQRVTVVWPEGARRRG